MSKLLKRFNKSEEKKIYNLWEKQGFFYPDNCLGKKPYIVMLPPPNITGSLHMGHALNAVCQDIVIRFKRMQGYKTLWVPGIDHAGIATQNVVEKQLLQQGKTRHDLGKKKFLKKIWQWKKKYGHIILEQLKILGASCDWSRTHFTMEPQYQEAVKNAFIKYYKKGLIYQGKRIVNWCTHCQTALSDIELKYKEEKSFLWFIKYQLKGQKKYISVATTRPETMLGDTAVAVNPKDKRYKKLIGKIAVLPLINREIPIIADELVDPNFGTGAVKITPAHDPIDFEIAQKHQLKIIKVINEKGTITLSGKHRGLSVESARKKIEADLIKEKLMDKKESYVHQVGYCDRCGSKIEPLLSKQWFLSMEPLAKKAIRVVKQGKIKFVPKRYKKVYLDWMRNIKDWCLSRQIWWGHQLPVWQSHKGKNKRIYVGSNPKKGYIQVEDVLDTWFSSALWPFAALGWTGNLQKDRKNQDLKNFYPTSTLFTAKDIIFLWVARMIFSGLFFMKEIPFKKVYIHSTILNPEGKRMAKSLGTGIDPLELWKEYSADAVRFGLAIKAGYRQENRFKNEDYIAGRNFVTKIWNASRFVNLNLEAKTKLLSLKEIEKLKLNSKQKNTLNLLKQTIKKVEKNIERFRFDLALKTIYQFFWHHFCDQCIEENKQALKNKDEITKKFLLFVLIQCLKILHPFMPFVTEASFQAISKKIVLDKNVPLIAQPWVF